jgi:hypothetical protein
MRTIHWASFCSVLVLSVATQAHAYDLSRAYAEEDDVERGFVVAMGGLWFPGFGSFEEYHQLSLDFAGEFGIRFASIRGHNIFFVAGFSFSPQQLDPNAVRDHRSTNLLLAWGGLRYVPAMLCIADGLGCPFVELRLGAVFETADERNGHDGPKGELTVLPGIGYRFRFGGAFQVGARADIAFSDEGAYSLSWLAIAGFIGFGW